MFDLTPTHRLTLADVLRSPMTNAAELREIETDSILAHRLDIAAAARAELGRRADESSRVPLYVRVVAAVQREKRRP